MPRKHFLGVRLTNDELAAVRGLALERSCSAGAVVRWAVRCAVLAETPENEAKGAPTFDQTGAPFFVQSQPSA